MTSLVSPSFIKQKARQLKKEKSISLHQAYDEAVAPYGFANYKNYLNALKAKSQPNLPLSREDLFKNIFLEKDVSKKEYLAVSFIHNFNPPFLEFLQIIEEFKTSGEVIQHLCSQSALQNDIQKSLLSYFLESKSDVQALPLMEGFVARNVSVRSLVYEFDHGYVLVSGKYHLEFEFEIEVPKERKHLPHFRRDPMFGTFEARIDKDKKITFENPIIGDEVDGRVYMSKFKLAQI